MLIPFLEESFRPSVWNQSRWSPFDEVRPELAGLLMQLDNMRREHGLREGDVKVSSGRDNYEVALDVRGFSPKDINVSVKDNLLTVSGKHEEKSADGSSFSSRSFSRSWKVPDHVKVDEFKSRLLRDGKTLRIEAPIERPPAVENGGPGKDGDRKDVDIPVNHVK